MIQSAAKQALHHARETLNQRIDLVESDSARHLLRMAAWAADNIGRLQCKLPGGWRFNAALSRLPVLTAPEPPAGELHAWHLYPLRLRDDAPIGRDRLIERLFARGIGCSVHYIPLHEQPYWRERYGLTASMFPHSQRVYERQLSLPIYTRMTDADVERVIDGVVQGLAEPA